MSGLQVTTFLVGSIAPVAIILGGWVAVFRARRFRWLIVTAAILFSLPIGLLILNLAAGAPPPTDPEDGANAAGVVWGMMMLPAILLWVLATLVSVLLPPLAWLARKISG